MGFDNKIPDTNFVLIKFTSNSYQDGLSEIAFLTIQDNQFVVYVLMNTSFSEINIGNWKK